MKNKEDEIIYVGKAINLKRRVSQYFSNSTNKGAKVDAMVSHIDHFEYIIVENEVEALVLESNLIKKNRPKYNIVLRDDKQYPYIKITNQKFPRILKVRKIQKDKAQYFGPYPDTYSVNNAIDLFQLLYKIRTCNLNFEKGQTLERPCLNYYISRCNGACIGKENEENYLKNIEKVSDFLSGRNDDILNILLEKMNNESMNLNYEQAAKWRDYYKDLNILREKQKITNSNYENIDIIAISRGKSEIVVQVFFMRNGKIIDREHFVLKDDFKESDSEIISSFIKQFYLDLTYIPKEILVDTYPNDMDLILEFLKQKKKSLVSIHIPKIGTKKELIEMAKQNADEMLYKIEKAKEKRERKNSNGVNNLKNILKIDKLERIECYDISNISGFNSVGSMVVFTNGIPNPKEYRKFKIKTVKGADDYASHREVLSRRIKEFIDLNKKQKSKTGFGVKPDLILMDGGKGQVNIALEVIKQFDVDIKVAGLVKDDKHITRAIIYNNEEILINKSDPAYKLIYQIQEEAHRFAINYHHNLMRKTMKKSELDNIKGVGEEKRKNLYKYFKTIDNIKKANVEELMQVPLIGKKQALEIYKYFKLKG
ncbi:MAG: excinuclease ABC subunit UvrC [Peptoniphilaceae bacterium]|nr:excinuclease ABC subunit UvrC [Peptoniphilaceae bacterium]